MTEELAWDLAINTFIEKMGCEPEIIQGNTNHEIMVACLQEGILLGAKYQSEKMYTKEDMRNCWKVSFEESFNKWVKQKPKTTFKKWFNKYKKK